MKILVTGGNGFLGSIFCFLAREAGDQVLGTTLNSRFSLRGCETRRLNIRDQEACLEIVRTLNPDVIIHCARYPVGVGQCEKERESSYQINTIGTKNLVRSAEKMGVKFVYISTDWIFNGKKPVGEKYREEDDVCPLNYYGVTKWAGEQEVAGVKTEWLIIRPANIYGLHAAFLEPPYSPGSGTMERSSWAHKMATKLEKGEQIGLPDTMYQSPVLANHLAEVTLRLTKEGKTGIFHVAGREGVSRYQFGKALAETLGLNASLVVKGSLKELEEGWGVPRDLSNILPENTSLDVEKVEKTLGVKMLTLSEGLSKMRDYWKRGK